MNRRRVGSVGVTGVNRAGNEKDEQLDGDRDHFYDHHGGWCLCYVCGMEAKMAVQWLR